MFAKLAENWLLKLLSLIFAGVLWFFVMGEQRVERSYLIPLEMKNIPEGLVVANEVPSRIDVRVSGPRTLLINLDQKEVSIPIDLSGLSAGVTTFRRLEERLNISSGVKVTRVSPSFVEIRLDRIARKTVPVEVVTVGVPAEGHRVASVVANPPQVLVEGAEGELQALSSVSTEPISIEGLTQSTVTPAAIAYEGHYSQLSSDRIEVVITVEPTEPLVQSPESGSVM